jgi:diguanylate cyclase (GGDEF)-like protein
MAAPRRSIPPLRVAVPVAAACALVVAVLGLTGSPAAEPVGAVLAGLLPLVCAVALWRPARGERDAPASQRLFAAAFAVWGAGQTLSTVTALAAPGRDVPFPSAGDLLSMVTAPLAVAGLVLFARAVPGLTGAGLPAVRLLLDAGLLGLSLALLLWRWTFYQHATGAAAAVVVLLVLADLVVGCMAGLLALRRPGPALLTAAAGLGAVIAGHLLAVERALSPSGDGARPGWWVAWALLCAGWPLVAGGMLEHGSGWARALREPPVDAEARLTAVTTTGTVAVLGVAIVTLLLRPPVDAVSLWLVLVLLTVVWVREMLATRQRTALLRRLHAEATLDPLTGLANRRELTRRLGQVGSGQPWCVLTLDLDEFKTVNDVLGHGPGDQLLQAVATRLREVLPPRAVVARVGGDEFAVLLPATGAQAQQVGEALVAAVQRACADVPGVDRVAVSAGVGIAEVRAYHDDRDGDGARPDPLSALSAAGAAQRLAKAAGRDRVQLFDEHAARLRRRRLTVEERLRAAVADGAVELHYQPIVELAGGRLSGVEALARWSDPVLGQVTPEEFIAVAEESGLVVPLGELVLHRAIEQATASGLPAAGIRVSCNVSPLQLRVPGFHRVVEGVLAAHRMPPASVVLEVTEAALVEEEGMAVRTLHRLVELGVTIAIDDFGTGYSALGYLRRLPAQVLKIDRSLTASLLEEPRARAITRAVTELGKAIGLSVVVEGVESQQVADLVRGMGADFGQGSLFGQARPLAEVPGLRAALAGLPLTAVRLPGGTGVRTGRGGPTAG